MTLLVCGSRDWTDRDVIGRTLMDAITRLGVTRLVHGGARGADTIAADYAYFRIAAANVIAFPGDWKRDGRAAGPIRNARMLREAKPDACIAFSNRPVTPGTRDMIERCLRAGVQTWLVTPDGTWRTVLLLADVMQCR